MDLKLVSQSVQCLNSAHNSVFREKAPILSTWESPRQRLRLRAETKAEEDVGCHESLCGRWQ